MSMEKSTLAKIGITAAVALVAVAFFVRSGLSDSSNYRMVDELMAGDLSKWGDKQLQVHGWVLAGSIKEKVVGQETYRTFVLHKGGKKIRVFNKGPVPDTFKDQSEVVAKGMLLPATDRKDIAASLGVPLEADLAYVVEATELMAKCPSKYEGANINKNLKDSKFE